MSQSIAVVHLRALEPQDAQLLYAWENDPTTWYAGDRRWPISLSDIECFIQNSEHDPWHTKQVRFMIEVNHMSADAPLADLCNVPMLAMVESHSQFIGPKHRLMEETTVGCVDIFDFDPMNMHCSLGILIGTEFRRQGYARAALEAVERFAFHTLMVQNIKVEVAEDNVPSLNLFQSLGYAHVGTIAKWLRRGPDTFVGQVCLVKSIGGI